MLVTWLGEWWLDFNWSEVWIEKITVKWQNWGTHLEHQPRFQVSKVSENILIITYPCFIQFLRWENDSLCHQACFSGSGFFFSWKIQIFYEIRDFLYSSHIVVNNLPANAGDTRDTSLVSGSGKSPGGGNGNPFQYCCLENPHGQRRLEGYIPWGCKESTKVT